MNRNGFLILTLAACQLAHLAPALAQVVPGLPNSLRSAHVPNADYGWDQDKQDGALYYIIQIHPDELKAMTTLNAYGKREEKYSHMPEELIGRVRRVTVRIGTETLPQNPPLEKISQIPLVNMSDVTAALDQVGPGNIAQIESDNLQHVQGQGTYPPTSGYNQTPNAPPPSSSTSNVPSLAQSSLPNTNGSSRIQPPGRPSVKFNDANPVTPNPALATNNITPQRTLPSGQQLPNPSLGIPGVGNQATTLPNTTTSRAQRQGQTSFPDMSGNTNRIADNRSALPAYSSPLPSTGGTNAQSLPPTQTYPPATHAQRGNSGFGTPQSSFPSLNERVGNTNYGVQGTQATQPPQYAAAGAPQYQTPHANNYLASNGQRTNTLNLGAPPGVQTSATPTATPPSTATQPPAYNIPPAVTQPTNVAANTTAEPSQGNSNSTKSPSDGTSEGAQANQKKASGVIQVILLLSMVVNIYLAVLMRKLLTRYRSLLLNDRRQAA